MSEVRRREALGRNRATGVRRVPYVTLLLPLMLVGAFVAWRYFTEPHRVFGGKALDCAPWEVEWRELPDGTTELRGCKKTAFAVCNRARCVDPKEAARALK